MSVTKQALRVESKRVARARERAKIEARMQALPMPLLRKVATGDLSLDEAEAFVKKEPSVHHYVCDGCGATDVASLFPKAGVAHWTGFDARGSRVPDRICGHWREVKP